MSGLGTQFIKLSFEDIVPKFKILARDKGVIKVWPKGEQSHIYRAFDLKVFQAQDSKDFFLSLFSEGSEVDSQLVGKSIFFSFHFNELEYLAEGQISKESDEEQLLLKVSGEIYRTENRAHERLLTFPHHQVYCFFKLNNEPTFEDNVIPLRKEDQEYLEYKRQQKDELLQKVAKKIKNIDGLSAFRAMDVSNTGVSFIVNEASSQYFELDAKFNYILLFDELVIKVMMAKVVYNVPFVSHGFDKGHCKVGLMFHPVEELSVILKQLLDDGSEFGTLQKDFEHFFEKTREIKDED